MLYIHNNSAQRDLSRLEDKNAHYSFTLPRDSFNQTGALTKQFSVYEYLSCRITGGFAGRVRKNSSQDAFCFTLPGR